MKKTLVILIHAFIGWALCGAIMGIGPLFTTMRHTMIIHALAVPIIFGVVSYIYFKFFNYTGPLQTALIFFCFALFMDAALVAPLMVKSYEMFLSPLGTWIPMASIFIVTYLVGKWKRYQ
jgi:hypothetical protein